MAGGMGLLRLILALSVMSGHGAFFHPFFFIVPGAAVVSFFTISGFYMALVLNEKYRDNSSFLINRALRLYPTYYAFVALYILTVGMPSHSPIVGILTVSLVGMDWFQSFVSLGHGGFSTDNIANLLPIPQAWSVAVELQLYVLAAFMFRTKRGILITLGAGIVLRLSLWAAGFVVQPLGISLVFNVICFFALGGCAYLIYRRIDSWPTVGKGVICTVLLTGISAYCYAFDGFWSLEARGSGWRFPPLYIALALMTPFLFSITKNSALDNFLGNLSYPVYLGHMMVFAWAQKLQISENGTPFFSFVVTMALSIAVYYLIERPLQHVRQKRIVSHGYAHARL